jgi:hypothetical protein
MQITVSNYAAKFESLGDNCEFGFIQRAQGYEEGGLFRWARIMDVDDVIKIIDNDFADAYLFENLNPMDIDMMMDDKYGIMYHTEVLSERIDGVWNAKMNKSEQKAIYEREYSKRLYLIDKTRDLLKSGNKHFVFKMNETPNVEDVIRLYDAIRRFGNNTMLFVRTGPKESVGKVESIKDDLYVGYISKFAPYERADDFQEEDWNRVCLEYLHIRKEL